MSTVTHGMDTEAARNASNDLEGGADQITGLAQRLDGLLMNLEWFGSDAERVRASWQGQERRSLDSTAAHLLELVALIRREAEAQDATSENGGGQGSGTAVAGSDPTVAGAGGLAGWLSSHLGAFFQGLGRTAAAGGDLIGKIGDVLTGDKDWSVAAIAASALTTGGSAVGAVVNGVTGEDQHWFDEGTGLSGAPVAAPTDPNLATQFQPALTAPHDLPSMMQGVTDGYQVGQAPGSSGDVRITRIDNGTGTPSWIVAVPGTESWSPAAGSTGRDLTANFGLMAGNPTAASESVRSAMVAAGIQPGDHTMLVAHSQGGIIAAQLASDHSFVERFGVTNVMTYGAPIDHVTIDPGVSVLQMKHQYDVVPTLDLGGVRADGNLPGPQTSVTLPSPGHFYDVVTSHSYTEYAQSVRDQLGSDTDAGRILREYQSTLSPFFVAPGGTATAVDIPVSRGE
jgi:hypothetical protein